MTYTVICIGEPLAEISTATAGFTVGFGGDTLTVAIYCARAAQGRDVKVHYLTAVGQDSLSNGAIDFLNREGVDTRHIARDPDRQIGICAIQDDALGQCGFHYWRNESAARQLFSSDDSLYLQALHTADLVYLSGISIAILPQPARDRLWHALAMRRANGLRVAFDSNYRENLWESVDVAKRETTRFWQITDIALPTDEDEFALFKDQDHSAMRDRILAAGVTSGAIKCGQDGPIALPRPCADMRYSKAETVIDTMGSGDSFNGTYLAAIACGDAVNEALSQAHDVAKQVIGHRGAIAPVAPKRVGSVIRLKPEHLTEYCQLHANVWPSVLQRLRASNIKNYSIYLKKPEFLMFGYFEYVGTDFAADDAAIAADPITKEWWAVCGPMQDPFETRSDGEWWAEMEEVFHLN